ncbi:MAG: arginase [Pseudomonadota bacterium]
MDKVKCRFNIIGSAFGHGAQIHTTNSGPKYLESKYQLVQKLGSNFKWDCIIENIQNIEELNSHGKNYHLVLKHSKELAAEVSRAVRVENELCVVIGGDHSCGIGTWSGVTNSLSVQNNFGLIWIDAHMDAHTYITSPSQALHGMPLAILLDNGDSDLRHIGCDGRKINPENLVLIGVRSFEKGENNFLASSKVKVFYIEEVERRGVKSVFEEALKIVGHNTRGFGVSIDLDSFDPEDAPGVGSPEPGGLRFNEVKDNLPILFASENLKCLEIAEFNPSLDREDKTADIICNILRVLDRTKNGNTSLLT